VRGKYNSFNSHTEIDTSRRRFVGGIALALPGVALAAALPGSVSAKTAHRSLSFSHLHTGEKLSVEYHDGIDYIPEALTAIESHLADFRSKESHPIDPSLLDILYAVRAATGHGGVYQVISGYRSPNTNAMLRSRSSGVAKRSLHMQGRAIDVRLTGVDTGNLRKAAVTLARGGVGYYEKSNFVHLDTGRFRTW
jgi:uncharacterized protein YcbK (DUF882 family)